jgi:hypothetical protein
VWAGWAPRSPVTIHQPNFLPRLSTLAKLYAADHWIVLDDVQFVRRDYQHRTRLADLHDPTIQRWLTLPVHLPHGRATLIRDIHLADVATTRRRVPLLLAQHYRRSPHWPILHHVIDQILATLDHTDRLADIAETSTRTLLNLLDWPGAIHHSHTLPARTDRSARLADLTTAVGATTYLCGTGGTHYLNAHPFAHLVSRN